jgi:hypothetical protein
MPRPYFPHETVLSGLQVMVQYIAEMYWIKHKVVFLREGNALPSIGRVNIQVGDYLTHREVLKNS